PPRIYTLSLHDALPISSGLTYSQMSRYIAKPGTPLKFTDGLGATSDPKFAVLDPKTQQPVSNGRRDLWVTYTALTTALNTSYMRSEEHTSELQSLAYLV